MTLTGEEKRAETKLFYFFKSKTYYVYETFLLLFIFTKFKVVFHEVKRKIRRTESDR